MNISFDNSYARLPEKFFARCQPAPVSSPRLIRFNHALAHELGIDTGEGSSDSLAELLSGNSLPRGSDPIAMAYAGHQFGVFVPQLGDGRALLLGEVIGRDGRRRDIQLKGSGPTPFSRGGDGRAPLGPVLREYILSEAMHSLGVPTTRSLAAVACDDRVYREQPFPGAVLTRIASSHIRVGTFQYFAARNDSEAIKLLADYTIDRHFPSAREAENPFLELLAHVVDGQAILISKWLQLGFIHGVMNTDNTSIACETIDYGPCAFLDEYRPDKVFSSIDHAGRYAYGNQPALAQWNLVRLAESLLPVIHSDQETAIKLATDVLEQFAPRQQGAWLEGMGKKIGMEADTAKLSEDRALVDDLLEILARENFDFTLFFRQLDNVVEHDNPDVNFYESLNCGKDAFSEWMRRWRERLAGEKRDAKEIAKIMRSVNPAYIPRNHLVERAIVNAQEQGDVKLFNKLVDVLANPFEEQSGCEEFALPPLERERVTKTFCGT